MPLFQRAVRRAGRKTAGALAIIPAILLSALLSVQCSPQVPKLDPLGRGDVSGDPAMARLRDLAARGHAEFLEMCLRNCRQRYKDYRCAFLKQERIDGLVGAEQETRVKFRASPFSLAMLWARNPDLGDRMLYVEGLYGGRMLIRPTGVVAQLLAGKTVLRRPDAPDVKKRTLRTVDQFGFENSLAGLLAVYRLAKEKGDLKEELGSDANVLGRGAIALIRYLPEKPEYPAWKTITYIDRDYLVPIAVEGYGWRDGEFICRYVYKDVQFNVGLTDEDFRPENNDLQTPKTPEK